MIHWLGFRQIGIPYVRLGRTGGTSKVDLAYLVEFTLNAVFNVSTKPLRMFSVLGLAILVLTFVWVGISAVSSLLGLQGTGISLVPMLLLLNLAIMSLGIGILGEYVARIFTQGKHRPLWLVDYALNLRPAQCGELAAFRPAGTTLHVACEWLAPNHPSKARESSDHVHDH